MSGRYMRLGAGRYVLTVPSGHGPAGVHRESDHVRVDRSGGRVPFDVSGEERVYLWWRDAAGPPGIRLVGRPLSEGRPSARIA